MTVQMNVCQCEHIDHFDNGPGHAYQQKPATITVIDAWGTWPMCAACASHHGSEFN